MNAKKFLDRLEALLQSRGLSERKASQLAGLGTDGIRNWRRAGATKKDISPKAESLLALAKLTNVDLEYLLLLQDEQRSHSSENEWQTVSVIGYVDSGQKVTSIDDHDLGDGTETVRAPSALGNVVAVRVRGDAMYPQYKEGDLIFYRRQGDDPFDLVGREVIVQLSDGRMYVKELRRGSKPGHFTLFSHNARPLEDEAIEWAAPVRFVDKRGLKSNPQTKTYKSSQCLESRT